MRVRGEAPTACGSAAKLSFDLPDGGLPFRVTSLLVRTDDTGHAFYFVNLTAEDFERLGAFTRQHTY
jgi:hypothetical protein